MGALGKLSECAQIARSKCALSVPRVCSVLPRVALVSSSDLEQVLRCWCWASENLKKMLMAELTIAIMMKPCILQSSRLVVGSFETAHI